MITVISLIASSALLLHDTSLSAWTTHQHGPLPFSIRCCFSIHISLSYVLAGILFCLLAYSCQGQIPVVELYSWVRHYPEGVG